MMNYNAAPTPTSQPAPKGIKQTLLEDLTKVIKQIKKNYSKVYDKFNHQNAAPSLEDATILFEVPDETKENVAKVGFNEFNGDTKAIKKLKKYLCDKKGIKTMENTEVLRKIKSLYINRRGIKNYSEGRADDEIILNSEENPKRVLKSISFIKKVKDENIESDDKLKNDGELIVIKYEEDGKDKEVIIDKENNFLATHDDCKLYWHSKDFGANGNGFDDEEEPVYIESKLGNNKPSLHNIFRINNKITSINKEKIDKIIEHLNKYQTTYGISEIHGDSRCNEGMCNSNYYNTTVKKWSEDINKKITEFQTEYYNKETDNGKKFELFKDFTENILSMNHDNKNDKNNLVEINILKNEDKSKEFLKLTELIEDNDNKIKLTDKKLKTIKKTIDEVLKVHNEITKKLMNNEIRGRLTIEDVNENDVITKEEKDDGYNWFSRPFSKRSIGSQILFCLSNLLALIPLIIHLIYKIPCCNKSATTTLEDIKEDKKRFK